MAGCIVLLNYKSWNLVFSDAADHGRQVVGPVVFLIESKYRDRRQAETGTQISMSNLDADIEMTKE